MQDCNTHPILAMDEDVRGNQVGLVKLGNANYLSIGSFFNHSCAPNTCREGYIRRPQRGGGKGVPQKVTKNSGKLRECETEKWEGN